MRILVVDDHPLMASAVKLALQGMDTAATVDLAEMLRQAIEMAQRAPGYDLCLLDLGLPDLSGIEALVQFRAANPELPVVVLSGKDDRASILSGLDAGAMGYIPKSSPVSVMINAIRLVMSGAVYVPAEALRARESGPPAGLTGAASGGQRTGESVRGRSDGAMDTGGPATLPGIDTGAAPAEADTAVPAGAGVPAQLGLSARQTEVLELLLKGLPNKLIARRLDISDNTVKIHVSSVLRALGVSSRTQALLAAHRLGLRLNEHT
jgi:DNA-binding NarL/FixJ family response regulator